VAPRSPSSPVRNALKKRVNVLNHVAYRVTDLAAEAQRLRGAGCLRSNVAGQRAHGIGGPAQRLVHAGPHQSLQDWGQAANG
jgi:hypothetical protein